MAIVKDYLKNNFRHNIKKGNLQLGIGLEIPSADVAEVLATSKFDWLFIDGEHGAHSVESIVAAARAIAPFNMTPVVRVGGPSTGLIKQLMDQGINNIIFPKVETKEEAEEIMYWSSFAPRGNRGMGAQAVRAGLYGRTPDYLERIADESVMIIQIESRKGLENLEEICSVPGIGAIFLGPIDLAVDMGHGLNIFHPEIVEAMEYMIKKVKSLGIPVGTIAVTPEQAKNYKDLGVSFLAVGGDTMLLASAADETHQNYSESLK
ncbi:aldolase/citrate lyase family protein [Cronobacter dublinensis]|uniref:HpcH/HpaI aldolase family protein n=1 Tax=Cronobacter dublinensis TaxID=413497 RepID=UPI0024AFAB83|nr:aldolase/citrate lyase family protein [Cronobacter dublinensis]MDI7491430.1 aldolase/citrate lyase family protein [Cronobacter dublinensis]